MTNPFEVPKQDGGGFSQAPKGQFDIATALQDGWDATTRYFVPYLGVMIVSTVITVISVLMCFVPAILTIPLLTWGAATFFLHAHDGDAEFSMVFDGFSKAGEVLPSMIGYVALYFLLSLPSIVVSMMSNLVPMVTDSEGIILLASLLSMVFQFGWQLVVMCRFIPALYLIVDQGMSPLDAITESWNITADSWGKLMLFWLVTAAIGLAGVFCCFVGIIPAAMVTTLATVSVYRQLTGTRQVHAA
jgi:uncharacterized membrane protein